jgi:hypothetical protein
LQVSGLGVAAAMGGVAAAAGAARPSAIAGSRGATPVPIPTGPTTNNTPHVRVRFGGLVSLVTSNTLDRAQVLMLSVARSTMPTMMRHLPRLRLRLDDVVNPAPDLIDPLDPGVGIWALDDCHVSFSTPGATLPAPDASGECAASDEEWRDPRWIADLRSVLGADAVVNPGYLSNGDLRTTPVATRVVLTGGTIESAPPTFFKYRPASFQLGSVRRPVTDLIQCDLGEVDAFTITRRPFDGSTRPDIVLKAPASPSQPVYVWIENHPDPESTPDLTMKHFTLMYDFVATSVPFAAREAPHDAMSCASPGTGIPDYPVYCPPSHLYDEAP